MQVAVCLVSRMMRMVGVRRWRGMMLLLVLHVMRIMMETLEWLIVMMVQGLLLVMEHLLLLLVVFMTFSVIIEQILIHRRKLWF